MTGLSECISWGSYLSESYGTAVGYPAYFHIQATEDVNMGPDSIKKFCLIFGLRLDLENIPKLFIISKSKWYIQLFLMPKLQSKCFN